MTRILLTGGTGRLGQALRPRLEEAGHEVRAASRSPPPESDIEADSQCDIEWVELDLVEATGIERAIQDVEVIIHTASAPQGDSHAVDLEGTRRLLAAAEKAGVSNFIYVSIVGVDEIPYSYYEHKLAAEEAIESSPVPSTVLRATQFHSFVGDMLEPISRLPIWPLPTKMRIQPISVTAVAERLAEQATAEPAGRLPDLGGPEVKTLGELAVAYRQARGARRPIVRLPVPGSVVGAVRDGKATCPERSVGTTTWEEWLDTRYGPTEPQTTATSTTSP